MRPLPDDFIKRIDKQFPSEAEAFVASLNNSPQASVRVNKFKQGSVFEGAVRVPWNDEGYVLPSRPRYT
ncbi:MAG: hypothetical protein ACKO7B_02005, partial [Flavobacteriales bacterium]